MISSTAAAEASRPEFFVSPDGDDSFPGTRGKPWKTLAHASSRAVAGTTIHLMDGVYREALQIEHSGTPEKPVTFTAASGARPVISGLDLLKPTGTAADGSFVIPVSWDLGSGHNQLFFNGSPLPEARHPNASSHNPMEPGWTPVKFDGLERIAAEAFQNPKPDHWKGAWFFGHGDKAWSVQCARVLSSSGDVLVFDPATRSSPWFGVNEKNGDRQSKHGGGSAGFLFGLPAMLDAPGEWLWQDRTIRLISPDGKPPRPGQLEAKRRGWTVDLGKHDHIVIRGLTLVGGAVRVEGDHNLMKNCKLRHASHFLVFSRGYSQDGGRPEGAAITLSGNDNTVSHCHVSMTAGCGIHIRGQRNEVTRCLVEDIGYAGTYGGGITIAGSDARVTFNTVRRTGRDCIHFAKARPGADMGARVLFNDCSFPGRICKDAGILYVFGMDGSSTANGKTRIAYNWFHDNPAPRPAPGIYLDNYTRNFLIDHNVVWNVPNDAGIRINGPSADCGIYHNTLFRTHDVGTFTYRRFEADNPEPAFWTGKDHYAFDSRNNLYLGDDPARQLTAPEQFDFTLKAGAPAIDAGKIIPGIDTEVIGKAPDLGAFEHSEIRWKPGHEGHHPGHPVVRRTPDNTSIR
jgi:hypothetical protein